MRLRFGVELFCRGDFSVAGPRFKVSTFAFVEDFGELHCQAAGSDIDFLLSAQSGQVPCPHPNES